MDALAFLTRMVSNLRVTKSVMVQNLGDLKRVAVTAFQQLEIKVTLFVLLLNFDAALDHMTREPQPKSRSTPHLPQAPMLWKGEKVNIGKGLLLALKVLLQFSGCEDRHDG